DSRYPADTTPFSQFVQRLVVETPSRDPVTYPVASQPLTWTRTPSSSSSSSTPLPSTITSSFPTSSTLPLRLAVYLDHPAGDRFALHPELAAVLDCAESDRVGVLEALWAYKKSKGLVVEIGDAAGAPTAATTTAAGGAGPAGSATGALKSGIKTDERTAKFFGNMGMVAFHHVPEYLNRWLMPPTPRLINLVVLVDPAAPTTQHTAYDLDLYVPDPARPAVEACARSFAALSAAIPPASLSPPPAADPTLPSTTTTTTTATATASRNGATLGTQLASLDAQIAVDALATTSHLRQLHALLAFARDPVSFLDHFVASQAGSLDQILASPSSFSGGASTSTSIAPIGMDKVLGDRWRDEIRRSENWATSATEEEGQGQGVSSSAWLEDAIAVWAMREKEGEAQRLRQQQQQQHAAAQYGRR
ncbi:hypothetical protein JCM3774_001926, partial [Rhodotorula dairenensis]